MYSVQILLGLLVCVGTITPAAMADERDVPSAIPKLPNTIILAATLERSGKWYALSSKQLTSVCTVLTRPPFTTPPQYELYLMPRMDHRIILWAAGEHGLVADDVVWCNDKMHFVYSTTRGRNYELNDTPERDDLLKLITGIEDGSDKGVKAETK